VCFRQPLEENKVLLDKIRIYFDICPFLRRKKTTWFGFEIRNLPKLKGHCHFEKRVRLPETYIIFYAFIAIYTGKGNSYDRLHNLSSFLWWLGVSHIMSNNRLNRRVWFWWAFIVVSLSHLRHPLPFHENQDCP